MIIKKDFALADILWYKIGGKVKYLLDIESPEGIEGAVDFIENKNIDNVFVCGFGTNVIFSDDYFNGAVIRIAKAKKNDQDYKIKDEYITCFSGVALNDLVQYSINHGLIGLEWAGGLPGTVGAGIRGNVGAFGSEIGGTVYSCHVLERNKNRHTPHQLEKEKLHFSYRNSFIKEKKNLIVVSATFKCCPSDSNSLALAKKTYFDNINFRKEHHPLEYPSCGSVFKNITQTHELEKIYAIWPDIRNISRLKWHGKVPMGYVIGRLGFSGFKVGRMQVSEKHANFIVNLGGAKSLDVITIIQEIKSKVHETFGFTPEIEVEILSNVSNSSLH